MTLYDNENDNDAQLIVARKTLRRWTEQTLGTEWERLDLDTAMELFRTLL